ncbi:hypothetical protein Hdeb2414_s0538g00913461 [Helianthus debilis subsp. tardiflorus]
MLNILTSSFCLHQYTQLSHAYVKIKVHVHINNATLSFKEREWSMEASDEALNIGKKTTATMEDTKKIESLTAELEKSKALVESERQKAAQALKSSEVRRQKLEETERTVLQLQDVVNR